MGRFPVGTRFHTACFNFTDWSLAFISYGYDRGDEGELTADTADCWEEYTPEQSSDDYWVYDMGIAGLTFTERTRNTKN